MKRQKHVLMLLHLGLFLLIFSVLIPATAVFSSTSLAQSYLLLTVDLEKELVVIKNVSDKTIDLTGYVLVSVKGNQQFTFPAIALKPGETVTVTSGKNAQSDPPRYLLWTKQNIWNNNGDPAKLLAPDGKLVVAY